MKYRVLINYQTKAYYFDELMDALCFLDNHYARLYEDPKGTFLYTYVFPEDEEDEKYSHYTMNQIVNELEKDKYFEFFEGDCIEIVGDNDKFSPDLNNRDFD